MYLIQISVRGKKKKKKKFRDKKFPDFKRNPKLDKKKSSHTECMKLQQLAVRISTLGVAREFKQACIGFFVLETGFLCPGSTCRPGGPHRDLLASASPVMGFKGMAHHT